VKATGKGRMGMMFRFKLRFGKDVPHIIFDGIENPEMKERNICIRKNTNATFVNIDAANKFKNKSRDASPHDCERPPLEPVVLSMNE
jgi:hypothetical protein